MDDKKMAVNLRNDDLSEETKTLISSLPSDKDSTGINVCKYQGCWYTHHFLQAVLNFQKNFKPQDTNIIVASFPKCGTTWLKALTFSLVHRSKHPSHDHHHPLLSNNPHVLVPYLKMNLNYYSEKPDLTKFSSSPRLFSTHMPSHTLQEVLKDSTCKVVYICRNMKDTLEEEENGLVDEIIDLCSLRNLSSLEINKTGKLCEGRDNKTFFRKGEVGDWKNYLTPEMENKIDMIIQEKLQNSGLKF
ncbi:unnamed protein product [Arabidopsis thaliana]|uniref:Sulfotransferase n=1 Tax=Arabidopsis thaliana TaxID=3702 RepID=A0A654EY64_ARATH|nr:unnamed protein product [Arabidopsis thaliana]